MVPVEGVEPSWISPTDFKSVAYAIPPHRQIYYKFCSNALSLSRIRSSISNAH